MPPVTFTIILHTGALLREWGGPQSAYNGKCPPVGSLTATREDLRDDQGPGMENIKIHQFGRAEILLQVATTKYNILHRTPEIQVSHAIK